MKLFHAIVLLLGLIGFINGSKRSKMSPTELKECLDKSKDLNTGCDFIKCFHERYHCDDESVTAWAHELCLQFPKEVIFQFTPEGRQMMMNIQNCTQDFLVRTFQQRRSINCKGYEAKYFSNLAKCYASEKNFCEVFKENRPIFMKQATVVMLKKPRALQAFAIAAKNCTRLNN